ncbi:MAG: hypothetical protein HKL82_09920 [Acidimicrobiaceae bacterium]|nr:hypothetical protein [Acidimicrobiaceae bacterium]
MLSVLTPKVIALWAMVRDVPSANLPNDDSEFRVCLEVSTESEPVFPRSSVDNVVDRGRAEVIAFDVSVDY